MIYPITLISMKKSAFVIKKWAVRALVVVGAMIGISSCSDNSKKNSQSNESPESDKQSDIEVVEDVYGPPIEDIGPHETVYGGPVEDLEPVSASDVEELERPVSDNGVK